MYFAEPGSCCDKILRVASAPRRLCLCLCMYPYLVCSTFPVQTRVIKTQVHRTLVRCAIIMGAKYHGISYYYTTYTISVIREKRAKLQDEERGPRARLAFQCCIPRYPWNLYCPIRLEYLPTVYPRAYCVP